MALRWAARRLELLELGVSKPVAVSAEFVDGRFGYRLRQGYGRRQPLGRAVGIGSNTRPKVVDATAGLGRDTVLLATLGCTVQALERSAVVAELLRDGLRRASETGTGAGASSADQRLAESVDRIELIHADAREWLGQPSVAGPADVILLDPMFPERQKSALVKKEMRLFRALVGEDRDADELFQAAVAAEPGRIVVKRPRGAPPMVSFARPHHSHDGGVTRYDVYLQPRITR
ncbi:MAG: 16S rRNA (guanine1516-N2)-methyltransferase [Pseudohongiellaceae bacterium]|jgi:16S rRNA (guanine1516-N2)-methyltransferase